MTARGWLALALLAAAAAAPGSALQQGEVPGGGLPPIEIRVSKRGFVPSRVTVRKGETSRIVLSSSDVEHCFAIDALRVEKRVVPGRSTRLEITPGQAGSFPFYCCLESGAAAEEERGELTVVE
jgi:heme/copper-type cytochrome/quinol oxidase subunit 2